MKLLITSIYILLSSCLYGQVEKQTLPFISYVEKHQDIGEVKLGDKVSGEFIFTNNTDQDLKIELVSACECTTLDWTRSKIGPGAQGKVSYIFDSSQKEESETIDVDIYFENINPSDGNPYFDIASYKYILLK
jgi:hypothetical protein